MKDIILKSGTYLKETKTSHTNSIPGESLENFVISVLANPTCCVKNLAGGKVTNSIVTNSIVTLKTYTTTERNALTGVANGTIIYNSTTTKIEAYAASAWVALH